jgi:predicted 3-demethylubiquinone-9 3-methyltransferase (glyoxalase superfamily)
LSGFGVSWQIVSRQFASLIGHPDPARARRAFAMPRRS